MPLWCGSAPLMHVLIRAILMTSSPFLNCIHRSTAGWISCSTPKYSCTLLPSPARSVSTPHGWAPHYIRMLQEVHDVQLGCFLILARPLRIRSPHKSIVSNPPFELIALLATTVNNHTVKPVTRYNGSNAEYLPSEAPYGLSVSTCVRAALATKAYVVCSFYELATRNASQDVGPS